ncbi:Hydrophobin [Pleurotus pulmonarius]
MFSRAIFCTFLILPLLAVATVIPRTDPPASSCSTGTIQCCNSVQSAGNPVVGLLAGLLGIVLGPLDVLVGVTCSPITVIGAGGASCNAQTVCCTGNSFSGLLVVGCSPININL